MPLGVAKSLTHSVDYPEQTAGLLDQFLIATRGSKN